MTGELRGESFGTHFMDAPEKLIEGSGQLTSIFGYWPSFHDAEVIEFNLWRGDVDPDVGRYVFPVLTTKVHLWELTSEVNAQGYLVSRHHTLATLRFHEVDELKMADFNHQNAILGLNITTEERADSGPHGFRVAFDPAFGMGAVFHCARIEVVGVEPFTRRDR